MKILYININMHSKNNNALLNYKNINFFVINHTNIDSLDLTQFDCIYSPSQAIDVKKYPNTKFIFGPHFSVFPENYHMNIIQGKNTIYIQPSEWANNVWKYHPTCKNIRIETLPFGVDVNKFNEIKPIDLRNEVILYYKRRRPDELTNILNFLKLYNITPKIFSYTNKYDENDYINSLHNAKFCIWLDAHESQGFALEEALSCNVPLLVWNVKSMNQEYPSSYSDITATTIPYWDEKCGEYFYNLNELEEIFSKFTLNLNNYKPREYILNNLTFDICEKKLMDLIKNININL
jgi:hypothetical protein